MKKLRSKSLNRFQRIGGLSVLGALAFSGAAYAIEPEPGVGALLSLGGGLRIAAPAGGP